MANNFFQFFLPKKFLGVDIGTSYVKIAEISRFGNRKRLENYGSLSAAVLYEKPFRTFEKNTLLLSSNDIGRAIKAIVEEAKIKTQGAVFAIPDYCSFFTTFELPVMSKEEVGQAIRYEAKQYIPMPLSEVTLDWELTEGDFESEKGKTLKVLLVAVPNEIINQYKEIAKISDLELFGLEAEVFSLIRALAKPDDKKPVAIIDIGAQSTTCTIVEKRNLKTSHSFDMSGNELTKVVSKGLNIDYKEAEELKKKYGVGIPPEGEDGVRRSVREILIPLMDVIVSEVEKIFNNFYKNEGKDVEKIIIAGGPALTPNLKEYFSEHFKKEVEIANPFNNIFYSPILEKSLKEMGPSYAIAVGAALRGFE